MKKVVFLYLILGPTAGTASDWVVIDKLPDKIVSLDAESIRYASSDERNREAWVKFTFVTNSDYNKGDYVLGFNIFNCESGSVLFKEILHFTSFGELKEKNDMTQQGWQNMPSDSLFHYVGQTVCSYPYPK